MKKRLIHDVETALGVNLKTPKDFEMFRSKIYARLGVLVSSTTLKRLWGYLDDDVQTSETTLSIISRFLGYRDWNEYQSRGVNSCETESNPVMSRRLSVKDQLTPGERLLLLWHPDRKCEVEYLGDLKFRVVASENTRLRPGDTFSCNLIVAGEPLYIDNLQQGQNPPIAYVCGKKSGVRFELKGELNLPGM